MGECSLHEIHNAFGCGIDAFNGEIEVLLIDFYYDFKRFAAQFEDFKTDQEFLGLLEHDT